MRVDAVLQADEEDLEDFRHHWKGWRSIEYLKYGNEVRHVSALVRSVAVQGNADEEENDNQIPKMIIYNKDFYSLYREEAKTPSEKKEKENAKYLEKFP